MVDKICEANFETMGFYWSTFLYFGRMCSPEAHQRLLASGLDVNGFLLPIAADRWILHAPGRFVKIGSMDPILEEHEKRQSHVALSEAMNFLRKMDDSYQKWNATSNDDLAHLDSLIQAAAAPDETNVKPAVYICETSWCTLDDSNRVTYNIKCE